MPNIATCGSSTAGGLIGPPATPRTVFIGGKPIACAGDPVVGHGTGQHAAAVLVVNRPPTLYVNGLPVVRSGDLASCGDPVVATTTVTNTA